MNRRVAPTSLSAVLAVALAVSALTACGGGSGDTTGGDKAPLEIWVRKPPGSSTEQTHKDLAAAFTKATGVPARVTALFDDFETKLQQAAAQKKLPDLIVNDTAQLGTLVEQGLVREVDRTRVRGGDQLIPTSWDAARAADGKYYGVPFSAQTFALFVRKDWREKLGVAAPTDWDQLDALATAFTTRDPDGNGKADTYGYVIPGTTKRGYLDWYFSSFLWSSGGDYFTGDGKDLKPAVDGREAVEAALRLKDQFCVDKSVVPGAVTAETTQTHPLFETGKGGIYLTGPYNMARFDKSLGKEKYEILPLPAGPGGKSSVLAEGENTYLMAGSKNPAGQLQYAEFLSGTEGQTLGMAGDTAGNVVRLPVNTTVELAAVRKDTRWQVFDRVYRESGRYSPVVKEWTPFRQASAEALNGMVADCGSDPKTVLGKLAGEFSDELRNQGAGS
ncbi:sugar ABC transporter substrate-binding protein [Streptomyces sp. NPDC094049]|uniref:sugar ABC transporter substrate-binding protein n=1 Tax=Streptomyces sp. NPDC094049 TaxID=3154987 RepID=UPI003318EDA6